MIQHIKIENFKSIPSLDLDLGRVNLLIGENGCGKTNILEAVALGSAAEKRDLSAASLALKGIRVTEGDFMKSGFSLIGVPETILLKVLLKNGEKLRADLRVVSDSGDSLLERVPLADKIDWESASEDELAALGMKIIEKGAPETFEGMEEEKRKQLSNDESFKKHMVEMLRYAITTLVDGAEKLYISDPFYSSFLLYAPENTFLRRFEDEGQIRPLGIRGEGLFSHLADLTRKHPEVFQKINENLQLIDWFEGFDIPKDLIFNERRIQIKDRYLEDGIAYIDQRSSNEGFLYLLFYVTLFTSPYTPKFFAIDNIDNALNPRLCAKLIEVLTRLAKENDKQVLLTAHNPGILDGLNLHDEEQRLFVISRNKLGHTKALRIEQKPSANGHEPVRLSEQFLRGYIGGLPTI